MARGAPPPPQAPSVAQQVLQNENEMRPASPAPIMRTSRRANSGLATTEKQRTLRLLIASVMVLLAIALIGAIIYFLQVRDEEFASITPRTPLGSRRDRHTHIGEGHVGLEAFRLIVNDRRFRHLPMVLETPKGADLAEDRRNLAVLRAMIAR